MRADYKIRRLTPADHLLWRQVRRAALIGDPAHFGESIEAFDAKSDADLQASLQRNLICAAFHGETPVAISASHPVVTDRPHRFVRLFSVWTASEHRGQGLVRQLTDACIPGATWAELLVRAKNQRTIRAYEHLGFTQAPAPEDTKLICTPADDPDIYMLRPPGP